MKPIKIRGCLPKIAIQQIVFLFFIKKGEKVNEDKGEKQNGEMK